MRKLSEVPQHELKVGDSLISAIGTRGVITFIDYYQSDGDGVGRIDIKWNNGFTSHAYLYLLDQVQYVGRKE